MEAMNMNLEKQIRRMPDGMIAIGPSMFLDMYADITRNQMSFEAKQKFLPGTQVKITANYAQLVDLFRSYKYPDRICRQKAAAVERNPYAEVTGSHNFDECDEVQYDIDHDDVGWITVTESYLERR